MAGVRHLVNYICRGRRKSLFLFLATVGTVCFIIGRLSLEPRFFSSIFRGGVKARDLSVQDADHVPAAAAVPVAPVFPDPVRKVDRLLGQPDSNKAAVAVKDDVGYVSALNKTWMTWTDLDSPGLYRACVPRPSEADMPRVVTGSLIEDPEDMTITRCLENCNNLDFTYAALGRGIQCYCSDVKGNSSLLHYVNSAHCDVPCSGDRRYHCGGNKFFSLYRTVVKDMRCANSELKPEGTFPLIALASFPRSGNTWTRQLIERATGYYTGSYYFVQERKQAFGSKAFPGGNVDYKLKQTICIKSHLSETEHIKEFDDGAIILIRNPYIAIVAEVFRRFMFEKSETPEAAMEYFKTPAWAEFVKTQGERWETMNLQWLAHSPRVLFIHYEDMQANSYQQLYKIAKFVHLTPDPERITCATQEYPASDSTGIKLGNHGKKTRVYLTYDPFTPEMRERVDGYIQRVNQSLAAHRQKVIPAKYTNDLF